MIAILVSLLATGVPFDCTPTRLSQSEGRIWCAEGPKVRLAGIAAPKGAQGCDREEGCSNTLGEEARRSLAELIGGEATGGAYARTSRGDFLISGPVLRCETVGRASGSRATAWCRSTIYGDLSCAMVETAKVVRWTREWKARGC